MKKDVRCAVIGQHPLRFPWGFDEGRWLPPHEAGDGAADHGTEPARCHGVSGSLRPRRGGLYAAEIINILRDARNWTASTSMSSLTPSFLAYQRIIKQSGVVLAVYAPDLADGSAEDKAVSYALALGRPVMLIHPETLKTKWLNVPTEKAPG